MIHQSKASFLSDRMIRIALSTLASILIQFTAACASPPGGDWSQWRGPTRNGVAGSGPALADAWPDGGPRMLWQSQPLSRNVKEGSSGGYSSIVVAAGRVYIFLNRKIDAEPKDEEAEIGGPGRVTRAEQERMQHESEAGEAHLYAPHRDRITGHVISRPP